MTDRKLEVRIVAERLSVSTSTVYGLIRMKKLKAGRFGVSTGIRVLESDLAEFIRRRANVDQEIGISA